MCPNRPSGRLVVLGLLLFGAALAAIALVGRPRIFLRPQSPPERPSLVVLPFENLGGDPELELLASEVTVALTRRLSEREGEFAVISREASLAYKGSDAGVEAIADALGADYVLAGSADRRNGNIEIDAYLIRPGERPRLWAERFEWPAEAIEEIPAQLSERIAKALSS